jgi:receptor expression-enhancing protein 5/6
MEQFQILYEKVNRYSKDLPFVRTVESRIGLPPGIFVGFFGVMIVFFVFNGIAADFITEVIGMVYPMFMSFKAIESKESDDDKLWLTYWVAYAGFRIVDDVAFVFSFWIPFYYPIKMIVLVWLFAPFTKGAVQVYDGIIRGFLLSYQKNIDSGIKKVSEVSEEASHFLRVDTHKNKEESFSHKSF